MAIALSSKSKIPVQLQNSSFSIGHCLTDFPWKKRSHQSPKPDTDNILSKEFNFSQDRITDTVIISHLSNNTSLRIF